MIITVGELFAGIGGFGLGLERAGFGPVKWQVEIDDFCSKVLAKHWPDVTRYRDIKDVGKHNLEPVDLICGGFPCQPFSAAGKRKGKEDDRYLWGEMFRVIAELKPTFVIGENVSGIINMALDQVLADLEGEGYETAAFIIPACAVDAPHKRDRVWIIAYNIDARDNHSFTDSEHEGCIRRSSGSHTDPDWIQTGEQAGCEPRSATPRCDEDIADTGKGRMREQSLRYIGSGSDKEWDWNKNWIEVATRFCRVDDGVPSRVDRLKCLGNAVVPQVVQAIGEILMEWICSTSPSPSSSAVWL